ncbi:MAG TPA: DUF5946 family protein [Chloroflexia bacterium]|nr:DUF5946 family protein [Chloroflexia bacterium]
MVEPDSPAAADPRCPECGGAVRGGQAGCQALFEGLGAQAYSDLRLAAVHRLAVDTYCLQHIEPYCHSAKSYAAHLTGLCCGLEYGGQPTVYAAIQRWLNGPRRLEKPPVLWDRGPLTLVDVCAAGPGDAQPQRVREWASTVWAAYATQHDLARAWIAAALGRP